MIDKQTLSVSRSRTFWRCRREHYYLYELKRKPLAPPSAALSFGLAWHAALARQPAELADLYARAHLDVLLRAHEIVSPPQSDLVREIELTVPLVNPDTERASPIWDLYVRFDGLTADSIVEYKTTSEDISPGSQYWLLLNLDVQIGVYLLAADLAGLHRDGVIYDVARKSALRPLLATPAELRKFTKDGRLYTNQREIDETPEEYGVRIAEQMAENYEAHFRTATIVRLGAERKDAARDLWQTAQAIRGCQHSGCWPRNPDACRRYNTICPFFSVCTGGASIDDPLLFQDRKRGYEK